MNMKTENVVPNVLNLHMMWRSLVSSTFLSLYPREDDAKTNRINDWVSLEIGIETAEEEITLSLARNRILFSG
jgi:hypothetical protein